MCNLNFFDYGKFENNLAVTVGIMGNIVKKMRTMTLLLISIVKIS